MSRDRSFFFKFIGFIFFALAIYGLWNFKNDLQAFTQEQNRPEFAVRGTKIYDYEGKEFVIKGVNINGSNWVWPREMTQDIELINNCWKFNLVRVNSILLNNGGSRWTDNNDLDKLVNAFTSRKIVVMFEAHDKTGSYYEGTDLTTLLNWYKSLATKYKNNPYVWFNVMNEPGAIPHHRSQWVNLHQQVIKAIRDEVGANNIIMADGGTWGQDTGDAGKSYLVLTENSAILQDGINLINFNGKTYKNIIFSIHAWEGWNAGDAKMVDYFDRTSAKNLAVVVGEYGIQNISDTKPATQSMFNVAGAKNIGRIVWHWFGGDNNDLTTTDNGGGFHINSCTNPTNLSWLGQKVWEDNHSNSTVRRPTPTPTSTNEVDLVVTSLKVKQTSFSLSSNVEFEISVKNQGNIPTPNTWIGHSFYVDKAKIGWAGETTSIAAGESKIFTSSVWNATKTSFNLSVLADDMQKVSESNESNNTFSVNIRSSN